MSRQRPTAPPLVLHLALLLTAAAALLAPTGAAEQPATSAPLSTDKELEEQVQQETRNLERLQRTLAEMLVQEEPPGGVSSAAKQAAPATTKEPAKPTAAPAAAAPAELKPAVVTPLPGVAEELANSLYRAGEHRAAADAYAALLVQATTEEARAWAALQLGHCWRRLGNSAAALEAYSQTVAKQPEGPWAADANWWAAQVKWRLLWTESAPPRPPGAGAATPGGVGAEPPAARQAPTPGQNAAASAPAVVSLPARKEPTP